MDVTRILNDLRAERERIDKAIAALEGLDLGSTHSSRRAAPASRTATKSPGRPRRRTMSAAARKAISEAAKKRWAERKRAAAK